jgi:hypothetical protein
MHPPQHASTNSSREPSRLRVGSRARGWVLLACALSGCSTPDEPVETDAFRLVAFDDSVEVGARRMIGRGSCRIAVRNDRRAIG